MVAIYILLFCVVEPFNEVVEELMWEDSEVEEGLCGMHRGRHEFGGVGNMRSGFYNIYE